MAERIEAVLARMVRWLKVAGAGAIAVGLVFLLVDGIAQGFEGLFYAWFGLAAFGILCVATGWRSPVCGALLLGAASVAGYRLSEVNSLGGMEAGATGALFLVPFVAALVFAVAALCAAGQELAAARSDRNDLRRRQQEIEDRRRLSGVH